MTALPPALIYLIGILFLPLLAGRARKAWTLFIGVVGLGLTLGLSPAVPESDPGSARDRYGSPDG